jgi:c(7)-type cytochrome triheme protein
MKTGALAIVIATVIALTAGVLAAPPGQDLQWDTALGVVTFSSEAHASAGNDCTACHDMTGGEAGIFAMAHGSETLTMAEMNEGKGCGACHNGETAFATADPASCMNCHQAQ